MKTKPSLQRCDVRQLLTHCVAVVQAHLVTELQRLRSAASPTRCTHGPSWLLPSYCGPLDSTSMASANLRHLKKQDACSSVRSPSCVCGALRALPMSCPVLPVEPCPAAQGIGGRRTSTPASSRTQPTLPRRSTMAGAHCGSETSSILGEARQLHAAWLWV